MTNENELVVQEEMVVALANKIIALRNRYENNINKDILSLHWEIGQEICETRFTNDSSYRELAKATGIGYGSLRTSVAFFEKYPKRDYEIKAWRKHVAELPVIIESEKRLIPLEGKFGTIYADPPWPYQNQGTRAATSTHYESMSIEDMCEYKPDGVRFVKDFATEKSHLHLWTTNAFLFEAKKVLDAWGFEYKGVFVWVKPQMGIGNYWRVSHEFLILGVKGGLTFTNHSAMSWMKHDRLEHSEKPEAIRRLIEEVSPPPRLELFARKRVKDWVCLGDEVPALMETKL